MQSLNDSNSARLFPFLAFIHLNIIPLLVNFPFTKMFSSQSHDVAEAKKELHSYLVIAS